MRDTIIDALLPFWIIGFSGSGKTTFGRRAAGSANLSFVDLDAYIEQQCGMSIPEIFRDFGEARFRRMELAAVRELVGFRGVVALGGGAVEISKVRTAIKHSGTVLYIDAQFPDCYARISGDPNRPLAAGSFEALFTRYRSRYPLYRALQDRTVSGGRELTAVIRSYLEEQNRA